MITLKQFSRGLALCAICVLSPSLSSATVLWTGDFETGNISQWSYNFLPEQLRVVSTPTRAGKFALEARAIKNGDRVEVQNGRASTRAGSDRYYAWSVMTPKPLGPDVHQTGYFESKNTYNQIMSFGIQGADVSLDTRLPTSQRRWTGRGKFTSGQWHDFVFHVRWSQDPNVGLIELWFDREKVLGPLPLQTLWDQNEAFFQIGFLSGQAGELIYIDEARETTTLQEALGEPAPEPGAAGAGGMSSTMAGGRGGSGGVAAAGGSGGSGRAGAGGGNSITGRAGAGDSGDDAAGTDDSSLEEDQPSAVRGRPGCSWGAADGRAASIFSLLLVAAMLSRRRRIR